MGIGGLCQPRSVLSREPRSRSMLVHFCATKEGLLRAVVADIAASLQPLIMAFASKSSSIAIIRTYVPSVHDGLAVRFHSPNT